MNRREILKSVVGFLGLAALPKTQGADGITSGIGTIELIEDGFDLVPSSEANFSMGLVGEGYKMYATEFSNIKLNNIRVLSSHGLVCTPNGTYTRPLSEGDAAILITNEPEDLEAIASGAWSTELCET